MFSDSPWRLWKGVATYRMRTTGLDQCQLLWCGPRHITPVSSFSKDKAFILPDARSFLQTDLIVSCILYLMIDTTVSPWVSPRRPGLFQSSFYDLLCSLSGVSMSVRLFPLPKTVSVCPLQAGLLPTPLLKSPRPVGLFQGAALHMAVLSQLSVLFSCSPGPGLSTSLLPPPSNPASAIARSMLCFSSIEFIVFPLNL